MEGLIRGAASAPGVFTDDALAALRALDAMGHEPVILGYHPTARMNPYHSLLYQQTWRAGIAALPIVHEETIPELTELTRLGFTTVLHLHWLNLVLGGAESDREARRDRIAFLGRVDRYLDAGGRLAWTVHNVMPHAARFEQEEARLSTEIVERCSVVHIMAPGTPDIVAPWFTIPPDKILQVPHPSYLGAYEDRISREQARHELGLWPDERVYVALGAIRPYKGLSELVDAWDTLPGDGPPRRLVIAGGPTQEEGIAELLERAALHPAILLHASPVAPEHVQIFLRAADIAVMPYIRSLNSGALLLALTFGLPVVVPSSGGLAETVDEPFARTFRVDEPGSLAAAITAADELVTPEARAAAIEVAARHAPGPLSERFAMELRARLGGPAIGGGAAAHRDGRASVAPASPGGLEPAALSRPPTG